jgi:hypothetical protein
MCSGSRAAETFLACNPYIRRGVYPLSVALSTVLTSFSRGPEKRQRKHFLPFQSSFIRKLIGRWVCFLSLRLRPALAADRG